MAECEDEGHQTDAVASQADDPAAISGVFGAYLDKREVMAALLAAEPEDLSAEPEVWVDYISDLGDGFDPTYAVAYAASKPALHLRRDGGANDPAVPAQRGRVVVLGGDECYPTASAAGYENQLVGPYRAALPHSADDATAPSIYAIPGNHDWYDGLTSFLRIFAQGSWIGGRRTKQTRSYFAVKLPHKWWLWGIDVQFNTYVDDPQRRYFLEMAERLEPGDAVILCTATPSWVNSNEKDDPEAYAVVDWFDRTVIRPRGAVVQVALSGDTHHYAHYAETNGGRHRFTAGGGGAFLSATHHLPDRIVVPPPASRARHKTEPHEYELTTCFPDRGESRGIARRAGMLLWRNPGFPVMLGAVYALIAAALWASLVPVGGVRHADYRTLLSGLVISLPALALVVLVLGALTGFAKTRRLPVRLGAGLVHGAAHLLLATALTEIAVAAFRDTPGRWLLAAIVGFVAVTGGLIGSEMFAVYLYVADRWLRLNGTELFSAMSIGDWKNFLRLHVEPDGTLVVFPVGIRRVPRAWAFDPDAPETEPWLKPAAGEEMTPFLLESPVRISPPTVPPVADLPGQRESTEAATARRTEVPG